MTKILGYIISLAGIIAVAYASFPASQKIISIPENIPTPYITIAGAILALIGILIIVKSGNSKQTKEVPIYEGKKIIGYRRN